MRIALAGDTMLGRGVAEALALPRRPPLFAPEIAAAVADVDLFLVNLECCVSARGLRWPNPRKLFFFRAPPIAAEVLAELGVGCVNLANNHALDFGAEALRDTLDSLMAAGIKTVGAGMDLAQARTPAVFELDVLRVAVLGVTDHPEEYAAADDKPGVAYVDFPVGVPDWLTERLRRLRHEVDVVLVSPHWGPNLALEPPPYVRRAAAVLVAAGATVVAGHSAHVCHAVCGPVLFDLGDFIDDYAVHIRLHNDLGLLFLLTLDELGPIRLDALPIALDFCHTRIAGPAEYAWMRDRFTAACAAFDTSVEDRGDRLTVRCR